MTEVNYEEEWIIRQLARRIYLAYCEHNNTTPFRGDYAPAWAIEYAEIAVETLGYDDVAASRLSGDVVAP
jgi:hypothetical protein